MKAISLLDKKLEDPRSDYRRGKRAASERFMGIPIRGRRIRGVKMAPELVANLIGVGVAEKRTGRQACGTPSITFYVRRKVPKSRLTRALMLPKTIDGLTCDVVACGNIRPATGGEPWTPLSPLTPGAQIQVQGASPGTLGGFVRDAAGDICLISNCHVLSPDLATAGRPVYQPALSLTGSRQIGTVSQVIPISADRKNTVDVAVAKLDTSIAYDPEIPDIGLITQTGTPRKSIPVAKYGQSSLHTTGKFDSIDADIVLPYGFIDASFSNVYVFRYGDFAADGDSGSVVVETTTGKAIGLIFATCELLNFVIPWEAITQEIPDLIWL